MEEQNHFIPPLIQEENRNEEKDDVEQDDEALSLCDLPLTGANEDPRRQSHERRRSLSEMADLFEFLTPALNRSSRSWNSLVWPFFSSTADNPAPPPPSLNDSVDGRAGTRSSSIRPLGHVRNRRDGANRLSQVRFSADRETSYRCRSPPWYKVAMRPLRFPVAAEIELRRGDKIPQARSPTTLFPADKKASHDRRGWKLINALSCKSHGSVVATPPFHP